MKVSLKRNTRYLITLNLSIILSEVIFICLFYFFPKLPYSAIPQFQEPIILLDEIPITRQPSNKNLIKPVPPQIEISDKPEEPELLADVSISESFKMESTEGDILSSHNASLSYIASSPRLIFEVLPKQQRENISGSIKFSLKISETGNVVDHRIIYNNLNCNDCIMEILAAAYKSKWESRTHEGIAAECWVEKTYSFY